MHIAIRVDASVQIGTGHLMRCLTLANQIKHLNGEVVFICRHLPESLATLVEQNGHTVRRLLPVPLINTTDLVDSDSNENLPSHAHWLHATWQQDAYATKEILHEIGELEYLVIDHYALDARWESALRPYVSKIMVIDDLADRQHDCNLLLDQNIHDGMDHRYTNLVPSNCQLLLGPKYALLRNEFAIWQSSAKIRSSGLKRLLVFFGGSDLENMTQLALNAIKKNISPLPIVDVVIGATNPHRQSIESFCANNENFYSHYQIENFASLMTVADLSIGAGGSTTWERCVLGLPALVVAIAENQISIAQATHNQGCLFYLGESKNITEATINHALKRYIDEPVLLSEMSIKALELADAFGCQRVVQRLKE